MASLGGVPMMDFSIVGDLGNTYKDAQRQATRERTLAELGSGAIDQRTAVQRLMAVDPQTARALSDLGNNDRDFAFRQDESRRTQGNADRTYGLAVRTLEGGKMPAGFQAGPNGGLQPTPGGPEDPDYLRRKTDATDKGRPMSITDITKLTEEGQKFSDLGRFTDTFKPEFAGYGSTAVGNMANIAGRHLPESVVGKSMAEGSTWWQGYDKYKNVVRHDLYGSALTAPETAAFERADITPGMTPDQIQKNLTLQKEIVTNGLKRKASAMISQGYKADVIGKAYGVDLSGLGVAPNKSEPAPTASAGKPQADPNAQAKAAFKANPQAVIAEARDAVAKGKDPNAVAARLGINPALLTGGQ